MNKVASKVWDDTVKTCSFIISTTALYIAARAFENHAIGTNYLGGNFIGENVDKFDNGKKTKPVAKQ